MNKVILNEYILEGVGEMYSLIIHEVQSFFKRFPQRLSFIRRSNTSFTVQDKKLGQIEVSYKYNIQKDVWEVLVNDKEYRIEEGRKKNVSEIALKMVKMVIDSLSS
jgi:hypothetical protein